MNHHRILRLTALLSALALAGCTAPAPEPTPDPTREPVTASIGDTLAGEEWTVTINTVTFDADDAIAEANEFNPAPADGTQYALVDVTLERTARTPASAVAVDITMHTGADEHHVAAAQAPTQLHVLEEFAAETPVAGSLAYLLPSGTREVDIHVTLGIDETFIIPVR